MRPDFALAPTEFKFADAAAGSFSGYAAVFGNVDSHGDVIVPGAFKESLAERKAQGRSVPLHLMHAVLGGDGLPAGVLHKLEEDDRGLLVEGKISAPETDHGRRVIGLMRDGAFGGMSIGFSLRRNGATYGKAAGEPKRTLKSVNLVEVSLVTDPSNPLAVIQEMKSRAGIKAAGDGFDPEVGSEYTPDLDDAIDCLTAAILLQDRMMQGYAGYGSVKEAALLMEHLRNTYQALTGTRTPDGLQGWTKLAVPLREAEKLLREEAKLSRSQAAGIAGRLFKNAPRDAEQPQANPPAPKVSSETKSALDEILNFKL
ncbi:HK97 family phage prohead protease [Methylobacterium indicum]|uniref:HK97 family phage prohead protease n=1 Tax=Methylobacterium indicum TaxID=1775910 RepID=UPI00069E1CEF|nr:HK97 family phage prohead protease [Methylobacterium indicum]